MVVKRVYDDLSTLKGQRENGHAVGTLEWNQFTKPSRRE